MVVGGFVLRRQRGDRGVVETAGADEFDVVVRLERVAHGGRVGERGGDVQEPEAGGVVPPGAPMSDGRSAHDLEQLTWRRAPDAPSRPTRSRPTRAGPRNSCRRPSRQPLPSAVAIGISTPGAARSTKRERLENAAIAFVLSLAPTVSTCGMLAGYPSGFPGSPSLPDAATMSVPFRPPGRSPARSRPPCGRSRG